MDGALSFSHFFPSLFLCSALSLNIAGIRGNVVKSIGIYSRRIKFPETSECIGVCGRQSGRKQPDPKISPDEGENVSRQLLSSHIEMARRED